MSIREWSGWRIAAVWLAWPALLLAVAAAATALVVWRPAPGVMRVRAQLPPQLSDVSGRVDSVLAAALLLLGPPALLTGLWLWRRARPR